MVYCRIVNIVPVLYNRTLLFTHSVYNSLHPLIPNSQSFPLPHSGNHKSVSLWVSFCFGTSEDNIIGRRKKTEPTNYAPSHDSPWRSSLDAHVCQQWAGTEQRGTGCMYRVGTGPECPEGNLRELTWDSNPTYCGIAREERERERTFLPKGLSHSLAHSQNKGLSEYQRRASRLWTSPSPCWRQRDRWATARARTQGATLAPEVASSTKLCTGSHLLTKSSCNSGWLTSARRVAVRE